MEVALSDEQQELAAMVRSLLAKRADSAAVRTAIDSDLGYDVALWQTLVEQVGAAALNIPEEYGGAGFSLLESLIVLEELGRSLAPAPLLSSLLVAEALLAGGDEEAKQRLLPRIAAGETAAFLPTADPQLDVDHAAILVGVGDGGLVEFDGDTPRERLGTMDQTLRLGRIDALAAGRRAAGAAEPAVARARLVGAVGATALQVGLAARALDMTVGYAKERVQFGRAIGSYQALKHRMADMLVLAEMCRSAHLGAAHAVSTGSAEAAHLAHVAKSYCSDALDVIAGETVQLHGGIAITWEHDAHLVFKRAHALSQLFGQAHEHRALLEL
ncbi:acyl-CoA dehydrogenase family protein [Nocardioides sp. R-C-SC26]|uniref:acyl-CoA dehydrogenase family protein n=1 Tax=Nocardioides sp. R-C-SC26 TaxID=2870414 RepID=UPI001E5EE4C5|nr:acyl-CoA dehydrogenase family protein [Nocardioides sp. R-C-SC26]